MEVLETYHEGIIALSACLAGEVPRYLARGLYEEAKKAAVKYRDIFGENNYFLELQDHGIPAQRTVNQGLVRMSQELNIPLWPPTTATTRSRRTRCPTTFFYASRPARR